MDPYDPPTYFAEAPRVFPRIGVRDPYKRLGLGQDASTEEIQDARTFLIDEFAGHEKSIESIEAAYDSIIAQKFSIRKRSKINLKVGIIRRRGGQARGRWWWL